MKAWLLHAATSARGWFARTWATLRDGRSPRAKSTRDQRREEKRRRKELWQSAKSARRKAA